MIWDYDMKTQKELGEFGGIAPLVRMLDGKAVEDKEAAAKALAMLTRYAGNRRRLWIWMSRVQKSFWKVSHISTSHVSISHVSID